MGFPLGAMECFGIGRRQWLPNTVNVRNCSLYFVCVCGVFYFFNFYLNKFLFYIEVQLVNNVVLVSGEQQSNSVIHVHVSILFPILFPSKLLPNIEQSSLCYTAGLCWLSILNIVYICQSQTPNLSLPPSSVPQLFTLK